MSYKKLRQQAKAKTELYLHYKELYETAVKELRFSNLKEENLKNLIDEVKVLLETSIPKNLIQKVIENGVEKHHLDKLIHHYNSIK